MVNAVSSTNILTQTQDIQKQENIGKLVKYINNEAIQSKPDSFLKEASGVAGSVALFNGLPLASFLIKNKKVYHTFSTSGTKMIDQYSSQALKELVNGNGKFFDRLSTYIAKRNKIDEALTAQRKLTASIFKGDKLFAKLQKQSAKSGKISQFFATRTGNKFNAVRLKAIERGSEATSSIAAIGTAGQQVGKLGKIKGIFKSSGTSLMLAINAFSEAVSEVIPTFKELGFEKGMKQLGKSSVKAIGNTLGYVGGQYAGTIAGTAIGTAICPGLGSAIGGVIGFACGMLGSTLMDKLTKKLTGKSEREKAKEQQEQQTIQELSTNKAAEEELKAVVKAKIQQEAASQNGKLSEDAQLALQALENLESANPFTNA